MNCKEVTINRLNNAYFMEMPLIQVIKGYAEDAAGLPD